MAASAAGTPAGTVIDSAAQADFDINGVRRSTTSNPVSITVDEIIDAAVVALTSQVLVEPGEDDQALLFRLTNTGNGSETYQLDIDNTLLGDDYDPVSSTPNVYFDSDDSGDLTIGDLAYAPGVNEPNLAADESVSILVLNDIPSTRVNGERGLSQLRAASMTGTGLRGTVLLGQGDGGVNALIGSSGGIGVASGEYLVGGVLLSVVKTVSVADPDGGNSPMPGATLTYSIDVDVLSPGTAERSVFSDPLPVDTTYVPASLELNGLPLTDIVDGDAGEILTAGGDEIVVRLGDLVQADGTQTVRFQVTIN
ncbi:MAG: hypothetical protein AAGA44_15940 [Pseudomonadota bacterium]